MTTNAKNRFSRGMTLILILSFGFVGFGPAEATPLTDSKTTNSAVYAFEAKTIQGSIYKGTFLKGKPSVLWFWAPWCSICRGESPDIAALAKTFKGRINVLGVAGLGSAPDMRQFVKDTETGNFPHIADVSGLIWNRFQIVSQPSFVFITSSGVAYRQVGALSKSDLFSITKDLIKKV